jgi:hypothetical protein
MNEEDYTYGFGPRKKGSKMSWENLLFLNELPPIERVTESYDFLRDYSLIHNFYPASAIQPNPFSNKAMFIINMLSKMGVKYTVDIFTFEGDEVIWGFNNSSHKLVNIIAEPNPNATGPAIVFCAHHDVMNVHSSNCQDNGASVCNLLRLAAMISKAQAESKRTIILFSDSEESGARGAKRFASKSTKKRGEDIITHDIYGQIDAVINLELTGKGTIVWSDCEAKKPEIELHESLERTLRLTIPKLNTPPSDAIAFRRYGYPVLCIGILPEDDMKDKQTWRLCHSIKDTIEGCDRKNMEDFTTFLFNLTKTTNTEHGNHNGADETSRTMST